MRVFILVLFFLALALGSLGAVYFLSESNKDSEKEDVVRLIAVAQDVNAKMYNEDNKLFQKINSTQVREYSGDKGAFFDNVSVLQTNSGKVETKSKSNKGWMASDQKVINFYDQVKFVDKPDSTNPVIIIGQEVSYHVTKNEVLSSKPVVIVDNGSEQKMKNFVMNLETRVISSNKKINAVFKPAE